MGKKLLCFLSIIPLFLLSIWSSYGQCPTSLSISSNKGNSICGGTEVIFTANTQGGQALQYQWQINQSNVANQTGPSFSTTGLSNGQKVRVIVTSGTEGENCSITSSEITMTVNTTRTPTVAITSNKSSFCKGESISFTASNTNGGNTPQYNWYINGSTTVAKTGASVTFSSSDFIDGNNNVRVVLTSSLECVTSPTAEAVSANFELKPDATISAPTNNNQEVCTGIAISPISFTIGGGGTGATVTGLPPGLSGSYNSGTYIISGNPTSSGEFNYTVSTTGTCKQTTAAGTISVNPNATIALTSSNNNQTVCAAGGVAGADIEPIIYTIGNTGTGAKTSGLPSGIFGDFSDGTFTISGSSSQTGTHNFTVTATGSCGDSSPLTGSITITENLEPSVSITSSVDEICEGSSVTFTATPTNGGTAPAYQWQVNGQNDGSNSSTFTTSSLTDGQTVTVIMTSNETCRTENTATSNGISITVNENLTPEVTINESDTDFCAGDEVTYTAIPVNGGTSPTYQWKVGSAVVGSGETFTSSSLTNGQSITVTLTSSEICATSSTATSDPVVTSVNENLVPSVTITSNDPNNIICSGGSITFTATPTNGGDSPTYQWKVDGANAGSNSSTFTTSSLTNGQKVSVILTSNEDCLAENNVISNEIEVQVDNNLTTSTPVWDYTNSSNNPDAVCPVVSDLVYKVEPLAGARSYDWTFPNNGWTIVSGTGSNEITVRAGTTASGGNITVTARNECGASLTQSLSVTTGTVVYVEAGPDIEICPGTTLVNLAGEIGGVITKNQDWDWYASVNGGPFTQTGFSNGGNSLTGTYAIPTSVRNGGTVTIRIQSINPAGPCEAKTDDRIITIQSAASLTDASNKNQTVCIDSEIDDISFTVGGAGKGATTTGLPAGITGTFEAGIYKLSGTPTEAGTFNYTVTTTGNCTNTTRNGTITVNPRPTFNQPEAVVVCAGSNTENISFSGSSVSGSTYEWVNDNTSIGLAASGNGDISSFTATNNTNSPITANITVTPSANNCEGSPREFQITVYPTATFTEPADIEVCNTETIPEIEFSGSTVEGTTYNWTNDNPAIGLGENGTGNINSFTAENNSNEIITANITVTPIANGCEGTAETFSITVNPTSTFTQPEDIVICNEESTSEVDFTGANVSGTTYTWTNDNPEIGLAASGSGNLPSFTASNTGIEPIIANITVIPEANECEGTPHSFQITVNPTPELTTPSTIILCNGESFEGTEFESNVPGISYSWSNNQTSIGLGPSGEGNIPPFTAVNETDEPVTAIITITPTANECEGEPVYFEIIVNPNATVNAGSDITICSSGTASLDATLGGGATHGTWTTSGSGTFNSNEINAEYIPSAADVQNGSVTLTYTTNDPEGPCGAVEDSLELIINDEVIITTQPENIGVCSTEPSQLTVIASGDNLKYEWKRVDNAAITNASGINSPTLSFNNTTSTQGGEYYVVVTGEDSCEEAISDTVSINVDEEIIIEEPVTEVPICGDGFSEVSMKFIAHANGAPLTFSWYKDNIPVDDSDPNITITTGAPDQDGRYEGTLEIINITTDYNGDYYVEVQGPEEFTCSTAVTNPFQLRLNEVPEPPVVSEGIIFCQEDNPVALSEFVQGTNLSWYDSLEAEEPLNGAPLPGTETAGTFSWYVTQTPDVCESERIEVVVTIKEKPAPPIPVYSSIEYCTGEEANALEATALSGASLNWYADEALENVLEEAPTPDTQTATTLEYWVTQSLNGCQSDAEKVEVIIHQLPVVSVNASEELVCAGSTVTLTAEGAENYKWFNGEDEIGTGASFDVNPEITTTYTVFGTNQGDCSDSAEIIIEVDQPSLAGTISGETSVCISGNAGDIVLSDYLGEIIAWEFSEDEGTSWTNLNIASPEATYTYENLTQRTGFRAIVQNGVCEPAYSEAVYIDVDSLPVAGELSFTDAGRLFTTCFDPDFLVDLNLIGADGQVYAWKYRRASQNTYTTITGETGEVLSASKIATLIGTETLIFQVDVVNGSCSSPVSSKTAILSLISSEIEPAPVTVSEDVICLDTQVTLSAETGYESGDGIGDSGNFDNASINQHGWRIINAQGNEENFETSANNTAPNVWRRVTPRAFTTASLTSPYTTSSQLFDHGLGDGNKGFALVSGQNTSKLETSLFTLDGMDEAILTFDQAYNLTPGASISVSIYSNGNWIQLYSNEGDPSSGNYTNFASGTPQSRPENKIEIDLGDYLGQSGLRIQFSFVGARPGDVWAIDNIVIPDGPQNVGVIWEDTTDAENPVIIGYNPSENWTPTEIGWNISVITTTLEYSNGSCTTAVHNEELKVFVFDTYSTEVIAETGSCGNYSAQLSARAFSETQGEITEYPTLDGYVGKWIIAGPGNFELVNTDSNDTSDPWYNPEVIFIADDFNEYSISWTLEPTARDENDNLIENPGCENIYEPVQVIFERCIALDFDGVDDYVDLGETYTGNYSIEAWILPFSRNIPEGGTTNASTGTIISGPNFEVSMNDLPAYVSPGSRWYHIAVSGGKLYVDGIEVGNFSGSGGSKTLIGARWNDTELQAENFFSGYIEEVRLWNSAISREQIRFLMNQRLQNAANIGVEIPMPAPGAGYAGLAGYYQLLADPALVGEGTTPDLAQNPVAGIVVNMETLQENTAPLPYTSAQNGIWGDKTTWTRPDVWDAPHSNGIDGSPIEWNIVRTAHDINSGGRDIRVLGLISENGKLDIFNPSGSHDETNPGQYLSISHYLNLNGIIDLTGESQLLQDVGSIVDSGSTGYLERDQQGTANSYNYNYWSFPVSVGGSNSGGSIRNLLKDGSNSSAPGEISFGGAHTHADNYDYSGQKRISAYWLFKFFGVANEYAEWHWVGADNSLLAGEGFTMKGTSGAVPLATRQNYVFRGLPNNGPLANISIGGNQNRLIGNPYPSALDAKQFILDNLNSANVPGATNNRNVFNGALYFWDHFGQENTHILREYVGGYATINLSGSVASATSSDERINDNNTTSSKKPGQFVPVGQGFFINTVLDPALANGITINGGDVVFSNSQRAFVTEANPNDSYFLKPIYPQKQQKAVTTKDNRYKIRLDFTSPLGYMRQILVTADANTTNGFDLGYDAPLIDNIPEDMYWLIQTGKFVIQGVPNFNPNQVLPLGLKIREAGKIKIEIGGLENLPDSHPVYLFDKEKDLVHDLRDSAYEIEIEPGEIEDRFEIVFSKKTPPVVINPGTITPEILEGLGVRYDHSRRELMILNPHEIKITEVMLFDLVGKQIQNFVNIPLQKEVKLNVRPINSSVYIVKILTPGGSKNQKFLMK